MTPRDLNDALASALRADARGRIRERTVAVTKALAETNRLLDLGDIPSAISSVGHAQNAAYDLAVIMRLCADELRASAGRAA